MGHEDVIDIAIRTTLDEQAVANLDPSAGVSSLPDYEDRRELVKAAMRRHAFITAEDPHWVTLGEGQPEALWLRGDLRNWNSLTVRTFAITGSRAASPYGAQAATEMAQAAVEADATIVTGGAYGIDTQVVRAALDVGSPLIVVSPTSLEHAHPQPAARLLDDVVEAGGIVVSQYGPGLVPSRRRFLQRSRLLAEFATAGVMVVEAGQRSSALGAAQRAVELRRKIYAVPGPITSAACSGSNHLLASGVAKAVPSADWLVDELNQ